MTLQNLIDQLRAIADGANLPMGQYALSEEDINRAVRLCNRLEYQFKQTPILQDE